MLDERSCKHIKVLSVTICIFEFSYSYIFVSIIDANLDFLVFSVFKLTDVKYIHNIASIHNTLLPHFPRVTAALS